MAELNSDDYENIWLRTKDRFLKWYLWILLFFSVASAIFGFTIAKTLIGPEVDRYIESDAFKQRVSSHLLGRLPELETRVKVAQQNLDGLLKSMSAIAGLPFEIQPGIISILDQKGERVIVQYGRMSAADPVTFSVPYSDEPVVIVTNIGGLSASSSSSILGVSRTGFSVPFSAKNYSINWVAVGK